MRSKATSNVAMVDLFEKIIEKISFPLRHQSKGRLLGAFKLISSSRLVSPAIGPRESESSLKWWLRNWEKCPVLVKKSRPQLCNKNQPLIVDQFKTLQCGMKCWLLVGKEGKKACEAKEDVAGDEVWIKSSDMKGQAWGQGGGKVKVS